MARFSTSGLDKLVDDVTRLGLGVSEVADEMLLAGAAEVKKSWQRTAERHGFEASGEMIDSIGFARRPTNVRDIKSIDIYPQGKGADGVRHAEKAFILHYGTSRKEPRRRRKEKKFPGNGIPPTHWVDEAEQLAADPVQEAMERVFDEYLKTKG